MTAIEDLIKRVDFLEKKTQHTECVLGTLIQWLYGTGLNQFQMEALHTMLNEGMISEPTSEPERDR